MRIFEIGSKIYHSIMNHSYTTCGTCSRRIDFEIDENGKLHKVSFLGGCAGNTAGISALVEGADAHTIADTLRGTDCRGRGTSCPDQLARAIDTALGE